MFNLEIIVIEYQKARLEANLLGIFTKIQLGADEDVVGGAMVSDFRPPLGLDVREGSRRDDGEADEEDVGLGVRQRTKAIIVLLA